MFPHWFRRAGLVPSLVLVVALGAPGAPAIGAQATPGPGIEVLYTPLLPMVLSRRGGSVAPTNRCIWSTNC